MMNWRSEKSNITYIVKLGGNVENENSNIDLRASKTYFLTLYCHSVASKCKYSPLSVNFPKNLNL